MARRHDAKGRSTREARHVRLYHWLTNCTAWQALSPVERCAYMELAQRFNGTNNGFIALSCRQLAAALHASKATASRALARLVELGFIEVTVPGGFSRKVLHATEYRLTEHQCDRSGHPASKAFMRWPPESGEKQNPVSPRVRPGPVVKPGRAPRRQNAA